MTKEIEKAIKAAMTKISDRAAGIQNDRAELEKTEIDLAAAENKCENILLNGSKEEYREACRNKSDLEADQRYIIARINAAEKCPALSAEEYKSCRDAVRDDFDAVVSGYDDQISKILDEAADLVDMIEQERTAHDNLMQSLYDDQQADPNFNQAFSHNNPKDHRIYILKDMLKRASGYYSVTHKYWVL